MNIIITHCVKCVKGAGDCGRKICFYYFLFEEVIEVQIGERLITNNNLLGVEYMKNRLRTKQ